jgi:hypothetical protein
MARQNPGVSGSPERRLQAALVGIAVTPEVEIILDTIKSVQHSSPRFTVAPFDGRMLGDGTSWESWMLLSLLRIGDHFRILLPEMNSRGWAGAPTFEQLH